MRHHLPGLSRLRRARMYVYYVGMVVVGLLGFLTPSAALEEAIGYTSTTWLFSVGLVVLSTAAMVARRTRAADAEAAFVVGLGAATVVHGAALITTGQAGWQSGARLLVAILMMWDWADYRRREADLDRLVRAAREHL